MDNNNKKTTICTNRQLVIYEILNKAQNILSTESLLPHFIYLARSMEEIRKKWFDAENRCKELENKLQQEKNMFLRKINEMKIDIETHYEKRLQAENKADRVQSEYEKILKQFEAFKKILSDKNFDDEERFNFISTYNFNQYSTAGNFDNVISSPKRYRSPNRDINGDMIGNCGVEDTGSLISDYTEDDIDVDGNEPTNNYHFSQHNNAAIMAPSSSSLQPTSNSSQPPHVPRRSTGGQKRNQRNQSASLTRNGCNSEDSRAQKRNRTRSTENRENLSASKEITAITTVKINEDGRPITVTSEIQHNNSANVKSHSSTMNQNGNKMELSFVQTNRVKNRKKRPSREFLQRSADESASTEDSEAFWNGQEPAVLAEIPQNSQSNNHNNHNNVHIMTPIIEAPTPVSQSRYRQPLQQQTPSRPNIPQKSLSSNTIPSPSPFNQSKKYLNKRNHTFKNQVILNGEMCSYCDKRTKFGKAVARCRDCDAIVHIECKDAFQRPCFPILFPATGKISDYVLDDSAPYIPPILQMIIGEIEQRTILNPVSGSHEVGLYRVNGSDTQIKQLRERLVKKHQPDLRKINDVHVLCGFVKDFLNKLDEHLITYNSWFRFSKTCDMHDEGERLSVMEEAILDLPDANRDTLAFLILHLKRISEKPEIKMSSMNLAHMFGQSIVGNSTANPSSPEIVSQLAVQQKIVEDLIKISANFYQSILDGQSDQNNLLFKNSAKTPELMRKSKTAVVLSSILGPAHNK